MGALGLNLRLSPRNSTGEGIAELSLALDAAAATRRRWAVLVLDELQQLGQLHNGAPRALEDAVRHAVERAKCVTYIFAGSQKHLLAPMYEEANRPLYKLCRKMTLQRIRAEDYEAFLIRAGRRCCGTLDAQPARPVAGCRGGKGQCGPTHFEQLP